MATDQEINIHSQFADKPEGVQSQEMLLNMGPQHPSTHGVLRLVLKIS